MMIVYENEYGCGYGNGHEYYNGLYERYDENMD